MQESDNVLKVLEGVKEAIQKEDVIALKNLSNQTIHTASVTQDPDNVAVAVIVYSLGKIIERGHHKRAGGDKFFSLILSAINNLIVALKKNDGAKIKKELELIRKTLNKLSGKMKKYIGDVFHKASINKASRIYEHGISMERTASLLGVTMYELADYAGKTGISDIPLSKNTNVKSRIKLTMDMFE